MDRGDAHLSWLPQIPRSEGKLKIADAVKLVPTLRELVSLVNVALSGKSDVSLERWSLNSFLWDGLGPNTAGLRAPGATFKGRVLADGTVSRTQTTRVAVLATQHRWSGCGRGPGTIWGWL